MFKIFKKLTEEEKQAKLEAKKAKKIMKEQDKKYAKYFKNRSKHNLITKLVAIIIILSFVIPVIYGLAGQIYF